MSGCLDNLRMPNLEWMQCGEKRNKVASIISGLFFFTGWWIAIDAAATYPSQKDMLHVFHICGVFGTVSMFMVNAVSNGQLRGEAYTEGCLGVRGAQVWFFLGFLMGFGALIGSGWILFGEYVADDAKKTFNPEVTYPGVAIFLQNLFIFFASLIYKFGRSEDLWS